MARTPKHLSIGQIASTDLTVMYTPPTTKINTSVSVMSFTNVTATPLTLDIYYNDGSTDFIQDRIALPGGFGKNRLYYAFQQQIVNSGDSVKVQADKATAFNFSLSGSEVEV